MTPKPHRTNKKGSTTMFIVNVKCKCNRWVTLRAASRPGHKGNEEAEATCWYCKPYPSKVSAKRGGGRINGYVNDVQVRWNDVQKVSDEP